MRHQIAFYQWRDMYRPEADKVKLQKAFYKHVAHAKRVNPKLLGGSGSAAMSLLQSNLCSKASKKLPHGLGKLSPQKGTKTTKGKKGKTKKGKELHLVHSLEEIGWVTPFKEAKEAPTSSIIFARFDQLVYDESKYSAERQPSMVYWPSSSVMVPLVKACHNKAHLTEIIHHFTDVALMARAYRAIDVAQSKSDLFEAPTRRRGSNLDLGLQTPEQNHPNPNKFRQETIADQLIKGE